MVELGQNESISAQRWSKSAKFGRNRTIVGRSRPKVGKHRPHTAQGGRLAKHGRTRPDFGRSRPKLVNLDPNLRNIGPRWTEFDQSWTKIGRIWPDVARTWDRFEFGSNVFGAGANLVETGPSAEFGQHLVDAVPDRVPWAWAKSGRHPTNGAMLRIVRSIELAEGRWRTQRILCSRLPEPALKNVRYQLLESCFGHRQFRITAGLGRNNGADLASKQCRSNIEVVFKTYCRIMLNWCRISVEL